METITITRKQKAVKWLKRIGFWGFLFFLIKGLVWLAIFWWIAK
ncbi:MAG: alanyl-tRNA synthetase [Candidatus Pseudobacter hemicellulosilyticus]|uniref:Alanyl-tRNA synthetase n=1 Tax=Candidatus Pseudobacter hemicellulosilyticus TaxID=3121375 RepID=A0AAJ6BFX9_9BACT|nr:MAG: alanyl-tRNA synthetase [Pseudobacter sp.]